MLQTKIEIITWINDFLFCDHRQFNLRNYLVSYVDQSKLKSLLFWHFRIIQLLAARAMYGMYYFGSFHNVKITGKQATSKEAPILALAPHSSFFDSIAVVLFGPPSVLAKAETASLPLLGSKLHHMFKLNFCSILMKTKTNIFQNWSISHSRYTFGGKIQILDKIPSKRS